MSKHYKFDHDTKTIIANILKLTEKEEAEIKKYEKYGYTVVNGAVNPTNEKKEGNVKRLDNAYILEYLKDDKKALDTYTKKKNEEKVDENKKPKLTSTGKVVKKGFTYGREWFMNTYPTDISIVEQKINEAGRQKDFEDTYNAYVRKNIENNNSKSKDEYIRRYYWTKVFVREQ